ncbi:conjugal transfer protein TraG N-terminal domain-containing protein [Acidithiobacillus thiooxidans]|uniref:TraG N-terminal Proteobacteria domain-containing protein n=1 Tax=Acidithiobacillus thiooxidans ATCC 19377 TaxID=637390 RepID=A0A543Q6Q2_ACITH|nr:conjugal transfer protein TraG N-terminal domain-containing protein [Acidithiobacillus thiooxidans]MDX5933775.1 conjugal transfer protein TraG N-terminal domain-containing protein [Acidithiobacillus thiooxidans]TQN52008.1 hypothetical protein DLNHIDIE_01889 [Acidithiobacillus thiooxidans ATCC 19377]
MTPTIYVVGNIKSFFSALTAIQMLFNPGNNTLWASGNGAFGGGPLIALGLAVTLVILFISNILKQRFEMHQVLMLIIVYGLMFGVHTSVNIENMYSGDSSVVQGVPVGIAYPASIFSTVAFIASEQIGESFQQANNTDTSLFTGTNGAGGVYGFDGPLAITYKMRGIYSLFSKQDAPLSNSVSSFVASCVEPTNDVAEGDIGKSGNLACSFFGVGCGTGEAPLPLANAQATLYVNSSGDTTNPTLVNCSTAAATLGDAWTAFQQSTTDYGTPNLANLLSEKTIGASHNNETPAEASELIGTMLQGTANTGYNYMNNMILNCSFQAGEHEGLSVYDPNMPSSLESYCVTKASAFGRQVAMNAGTASLFGMNMLPLMAILQFLFFAMAPIVVGVAMMQGMAGLSNLGKYLLFGAWTESWMPVAALINDYSQQIIGDTFTKLRDNMSSGLHITSPAYLGSILDHSQRDLSMANLMMSLTPVLTFAILSGSYYAFSQIGTAIRGDSVMDKNMSESTPTVGTNSLGGNAQEKTMVSTGGAGGVFAASMAGSTLGYNTGEVASSQVSAMKTSAIQMQRQATASASEQAADTNTILNSASIGTSSFLKDNTTGQSQLNTIQAERQQLSSKFGVSQDHAVEAMAALKVAAGGNLLGMVGKWTDANVGAALKDANLGGDFSASQIGKIKDAMNQTDSAEQANSLTSSKTASFLTQVASGTESTAAKGTAANLAKSAARSRADTAMAAAMMAQSEQLQASAADALNTGGATSYNQNTLGAAMESNMAKPGTRSKYGAATASPYTFGAQIAEQNGIGGLYQKGYDAAPASDSVQAKAAYAMLYAATRSPNKAAGLAAIAESAGNSPMQAFASKLSAAQSSIGRVAQQADAAGNDAAVGAASGFMAGVVSQTGTPGAGATAAMFGGNNSAAANFYNDTSGDQAANPAAAAAEYASAKAAAEQIKALPGFQKFKAAVTGDVTNNKMQEAAQWIANNPQLATIIGGAAAALPLAGGAVGGAMAFRAWRAGLTPPSGNGFDLAGNKLPVGESSPIPADSPSTMDSLYGRTPTPAGGSSTLDSLAGRPGTVAASDAASEGRSFALDLATKLAIPLTAAELLIHSGGIGPGGTLYNGTELTQNIGEPPDNNNP